MAENVVTIGEVYVQLTGRRIGKLDPFYEHQVRTIDSEKRVIVLDAPTGSGKTLAALARVIAKKQSAIFAYPTNALVKNQVESIADLLRKIGRKPNIIGEDPKQDWATALDSTDIDLLCLTGESLEVLAEKKAKGTVMDKVLTGTYRKGRLRILLTNPDTIYLAFIGRYYRQGRIYEQLGTFKAVVVDEFHLYSGPALARLIFMLNEIRGSPDNPLVDLIFLSATHGESVSLLQGTFPDLEIVKANHYSGPAENRKQMRFRSRCIVKAAERVMSDDEDVEQASDDIIRLYQTEPPGETQAANVKVLGVFSSVIFAIRVAKRVSERVSALGLDPSKTVYQIHGFVPREQRVSTSGMNNAILIGTSAVEVGIDFDVPFMVMEAHDLASFLQRFGRGGRHRECGYILYLPLAMAGRFSGQNHMEFNELLGHAIAAFSELPSYADFLCSSGARAILLAMALAATMKHSRHGASSVGFDYPSAAQFFKELVLLNSGVRIGDHALTDVIGSLLDDEVLFDIKHRTIQTLAENGFLRGTLNSVVSRIGGGVLSPQSGPVFMETDLIEALRLQGRVEKASAYWEDLPLTLKTRYSPDTPLFSIDDLMWRWHPRVALSVKNPYKDHAATYFSRHSTVKFGNPAMAEVADSLLNERNLAFLWKGSGRRLDYRIPRLYLEQGEGALVVGDWALIAQYLWEKQQEADTAS